MVSGSEMRVGDAEREAYAAELREHYASGRLTLDELNERLDKAFAAKTRGDLDALMRDLPSARPRGTATAAGTGPGGGQSGGSGWGPGGPGSTWGPGTGWSGPGGGWGGPRADWGVNAGRQAGRAFGAMVSTLLLVCTLLVIGGLGAFGIGTGRPIAIVLILAALALLRRLFFRRRVRAGGCGPRGRRR